jgi:hypothetical protein
MLFLVFAVAVGFGLLGLTLRQLFDSPGGGGDDEPGDEGPPWRRRRRPRPPGPRPRGPEPTWWPEFEREFRHYATTHGVRRKLTGVGS